LGEGATDAATDDSFEPVRDRLLAAAERLERSLVPGVETDQSRLEHHWNLHKRLEPLIKLCREHRDGATSAERRRQIEGEALDLLNSAKPPSDYDEVLFRAEARGRVSPDFVRYRDGLATSALADHVLTPNEWLLGVAGAAAAGLSVLALVPRAAGGLYALAVLASWLLWFSAAAAIAVSRASRLRRQAALNAQASRILEVGGPFFLYLRPFTTDGRFQVGCLLPSRAHRMLMDPRWDIEMAVSIALGRSLPLVCIGEQERASGAARLRSTDDDWRGLVTRLAEGASAIVMTPGTSPGTVWEMREILSRPAWCEKTLFLMPPYDPGGLGRLLALLRAPVIERWWQGIRDALLPQGIQLPPYDWQGGLFRLWPDGTLRDKVPAGGLEPYYARHVLLRAAYLGARDEQTTPATGPLDREIPPPLRYKVPRLGMVTGIVLPLAIVLPLRMFAFEPFRVPSSSMLPTLAVGDFIAVTRFDYNLDTGTPWTPAWHLRETGEPQRGDVIVFRLPEDPGVSYVKRLVGLPGDRVLYMGKRLWINGEPLDTRKLLAYPRGCPTGSDAMLMEERLGIEYHRVLHCPDRAGREGVFTVPEDHYFFMGDSRDNSNDSRYIGFIPRRQLIGKVRRVWFHWGGFDGDGLQLGRIGTRIH
jgi:signal peptidase I